MSLCSMRHLNYSKDTLNYETLFSVIPAKAGIQILFKKQRVWIPASAEMTEREGCFVIQDNDKKI